VVHLSSSHHPPLSIDKQFTELDLSFSPKIDMPTNHFSFLSDTQSAKPIVTPPSCSNLELFTTATQVPQSLFSRQLKSLLNKRRGPTWQRDHYFLMDSSTSACFFL
jgi:hypothetical protein